MKPPVTRNEISTSLSSGIWHWLEHGKLLEFKCGKSAPQLYDFYSWLQVTFLSKLLSAPDEVIVDDPRQAWLKSQGGIGDRDRDARCDECVRPPISLYPSYHPHGEILRLRCQAWRLAISFVDCAV